MAGEDRVRRAVEAEDVNGRPPDVRAVILSRKTPGNSDLKPPRENCPPMSPGRVRMRRNFRPPSSRTSDVAWPVLQLAKFSYTFAGRTPWNDPFPSLSTRFADWPKSTSNNGAAKSVDETAARQADRRSFADMCFMPRIIP